MTQQDNTKLNISEAARLVGISRTTFYKDIDRKGISIELDRDGSKRIDVSELMRVYNGRLKGKLEKSGEKAGEQSEHTNMSTKGKNGQGLTHPEQGGASAIEQILREQVTDLRERVQSLESDKDASQNREQEFLDIIRQQQTLLLPPPKAESEGESTAEEGEREPAKEPGFWGRVFGK